MRKALILLVVFAVVGATAFAADAQVKWQGWVRTGVGVVSTDTGSSFISYNYDRVGVDRIRLAFSYTAADGNLGFYSRLSLSDEVWFLNSATTAGFHRIYGWGKLLGGKLMIKTGILDDYSISTADWNSFGNTDGKAGMYFNFAPVAGLNIGFYQAIPYGWKLAALPPDIADFYDGDILGFSYDMKDIGKFAAGAILDSTYAAASGTAVYAGFSLSAIKGLTAILEAKATFYDGSTPIVLEQNLGYAMGALTAGVRVGESIPSAGTFYWGAEPTVSYKLNDKLTVAAIANVYNNSSQTFMSPIDADVFHPNTVGVAGDVGFGFGASVTYVVGGLRLVLGDFYAVDTNGGNVAYVNVDVSF